MNRVNILFVVTVCLLVAPVFTMPANSEEGKETETSNEPKTPETADNDLKKNPDENELNSKLAPESESPREETDQNPDAEKPEAEKSEVDSDENTSTEKTSFQGHSSGIIYNFDEDKSKVFQCSSDPSQDGITCPAGTLSCTYSSNFTDKNNAKVHYKCLSDNGTVLSEETKDEAINISRFSDVFDEFRKFIQTIFGSFPVRMAWQ